MRDFVHVRVVFGMPFAGMDQIPFIPCNLTKKLSVILCLSCSIHMCFFFGSIVNIVLYKCFEVQFPCVIFFIFVTKVLDDQNQTLWV